MRFTIIPADRVVIVDGVGRVLDNLSIQAGIHAVQWDGSAGSIEYELRAEGEAMVRPPNGAITSYADFQPVLDAWAAAAPPPVPTPEPVPQVLVVSRFQAKAALMATPSPVDGFANAHDAVEAAMVAQGGVALLAWREAVEFRSDSPLIASMAASFGWTSAQVNALFAAAALITA